MGVSMADDGLSAPVDRRAVIVTSDGTLVLLRLRKRETYSQKRTVTQGTVETGYKISDGDVTDQPVVTVEGIITGANNKAIAFNEIAASSEVANLQAVFDNSGLVSVYTSFVAVPDARITEFKAEMVAERKAINITLTAQHIRFTNIGKTTGAPQTKKVSEAKGQGTTNSGKKSVTTAPAEKHDILYFGEEESA